VRITLRFVNEAGFDAAGTHFHPHRLTVFYGSYFLEVRVPSLLGLVMGMTDIVSDERFFAAEFTNL